MKIISAEIARAAHDLKRRLRTFLDAMGFCEMVTPVLRNGKLRTCMELNLRSTLASGFDRVYEIGTCFREEQSDSTHLSEFQMLELFWSCASFDKLVNLTHHLFETVFQCTMDEFATLDLAQCLPERYSGFEYGMEFRRLRVWAQRYLDAKELETCDRAYKIYNLLIDHYIGERVPGTLKRPAMVINYPMETICLAKPQKNHPERILRAEFFIGGIELAHGFVDDMDHKHVAKRMLENGNEFYDKPFLELLEKKILPPSSGVGFGLERLLMLSCGVSDIRECVYEWE